MSMDNPLVSVVVPAYNHDRYIESCIRSIHAQSYLRIELVIVDDCSTDDTLAIAKAALDGPIGGRFENVEIIPRPKNGGAHSSINLAIERSKGDVISIINSDDLYHVDRLSRMVPLLNRNGSDLAFSICKPFLDMPDAEATATPMELIALPRAQVHIHAREKSVGYALLRENIAVTTGNFVFRRSLFDSVGPFLPLKYCHDWDFILQATTRTEPIFVPEALYEYRIHASNSYKSYQGLAIRETELVRERFFCAISQETPTNPLCPSPDLQPGYFEMLMRELHILDVWRRISKQQIWWQRTSDRVPGLVRPSVQLLEDAFAIPEDDPRMQTFSYQDD